MLKDLLEKRAKIVNDQRAILDLVKKENRSITDDEEKTYKAMDADFDKLTSDIDAERNRQNRMAEMAKANEARMEELKKSVREPVKPIPSQNNHNPEKRSDIYEYEIPSRYKDVMLRHREFTNYRYATKQYNDAFNRALCDGHEARALQVDLDTSGGYLVAPEQFVARLIQAKDEIVFVRGLATVFSLPNAVSMGFPALDHNIGDPTWTGELLTGSEDTTMDFDKRTMHPHPIARRIKVSKTLLQIAQINVDALVRDQLAKAHGTVEENVFLNGTGQNQPLGVFTANASGIDTDRDVSTDNTSTAIKADNLMECVDTLKQQYRNSAAIRWAFHRDTLKRIRKLKDGEGNYLWRAGLADGRPDTILGIGYIESEYVPHTFSASQYVGILGDWSQYWIADSLNLQIQVAVERYIENNQNAYISRMAVDGMPVDHNAWVRVKLAAS